MEERFSDSIGVTTPRRDFQIREMDTSLRNALWNWLCWALENTQTHGFASAEANWWNAAHQGLWDEHLHKCVDEIQVNLVQSSIKYHFMGCSWFEAYNLIQYVLPRVNAFRKNDYARRDVQERLNTSLEREMSGYRAVNNKLVPVVTPVEVLEIEKAATPVKGFGGVATHIDAALAMLSKKPDPDYRNSVKESMSAVETAVKLLTGEDSGGIGKALAILHSRHPLHPAFKKALSELYGYSCDKSGIRHALLDEATVTEPEARFMLVACSAFANFLISAGNV